MRRIQCLTRVLRPRLPTGIPSRVPRRILNVRPLTTTTTTTMPTRSPVARIVTKLFHADKYPWERYWVDSEGKRMGSPGNDDWNISGEEYWVDSEGKRSGPSRGWRTGGDLDRAGSYREGRRHGPWTWWHSKDRKSMEGSYVDGKKEGEWNTWDGKGNLTSRCHYDGDRLHGLSTMWHSKDRKEMEGSYVDGNKDGVWDTWDREGHLISRDHYNGGEGNRRHGLSTTWHPNGKKATEGCYVAGKEEGEWNRWDEEGILRLRVYYKEGIFNGPINEWHPIGKIMTEGSYMDGKKEGQWTTWDDRGTQRERIHYKGDRRDGPFTMSYPAGTVEGSYVHGRRHGRWTWYTTDGRQDKVIEYRHDVMTKLVALLDDQGRETVLPDGEIDVWKAGKGPSGNDVYIKIRVPAEARRVSTLQQKARIDWGTVVSIVDDEGKEYKEAHNFVRETVSLRYAVGEVVQADGFDPVPTQDCAPGIHVHRYRDQCKRWFALRGGL